jgi:hypothetical protein
MYGSPGQSARFSGMVRVGWPLLTILLIAGYLLGVAAPLPGLTLRVTGVLLLFLALAFVFSIQWASRRMQDYVKGAEGEEIIARALSRLPSGYAVINSLSIEAGVDWDHIVVGPNGVFIVETKNWSGLVEINDDEILVDGQSPDRSPLEQARREAEILTRALSDRGFSLAVVPILCFVSRGAMEHWCDVEGVRVCTSGTLQKTLEAYEGALEIGVQKQVVGALVKEL